MQRRQVIIGLGATLAVPGAALAQRAPVPVIGFLGSETAEQWKERTAAFLDGLAKSGFAEGRDVTIVYRWAEGRNERIPALAQELVRMNVSLIVVLGSTVSAVEARKATTSIPIVVRMAVDPTTVGLVESLGRPGGNLTGWTTLGATIGPKQIELLREMAPPGSTIGLLINPTNPYLSGIQRDGVTAAARDFGYRLVVVGASSDAELEAAFATLKAEGARMLVIGADTFLNTRNARMASLATAAGLPAVSAYREFAQAGGLMSYGGSVTEASRRVGDYAGRILKGEKASELPVQQVDKLDLVLNQGAANAMKVTIPVSLVARADEVLD